MTDLSSASQHRHELRPRERSALGLDWIGDFPSEYTSPPEMFDFSRTHGLSGRVVADSRGTDRNAFLLARGDA
jgi:hypothetical protein